MTRARVVGAAAWLAAAVAFGASAGAEIVEADLRVDGMACPFCAFGIEKKLLEVDGVESVAVRLDEGRLRLQLAEANRAKPGALERAVERAGFELAELRLTAVGTLDRRDDAAWLVAHPELRLRLREADADGDRAPSDALLRSLVVDDGGRLRVSGRMRRAAGEVVLVIDAPQSGGN